MTKRDIHKGVKRQSNPQNMIWKYNIGRKRGTPNGQWKENPIPS